MPFESVASFVDDICKSRILHPEQMNELQQSLQARFSDPRSLAWHLLDRSWLTTYQINQLVQGHTQDLVLGDYVILERLGRGGIGQVYKARRGSDDSVVALKVIRTELLSNTEAVRQFRWEVQVIAQLAHPNIVKTLDAGEVGGRCLFAMEYVEGAHVGKLVKQVGPLPVIHACSFIHQAALGLQHAYEMNLNHRDIKPANLFLALAPGESERIASTGWSAVPHLERAQVKILDWGLANLKQSDTAPRESGRGLSGEPIGTADYLAPEQALAAHNADIRSDIYSLGCTLYYLLSGEPPFPGGSIMQKLLRHQQSEPMPLTKHRRDLPQALVAIVQKMMAKRPVERYQTPAEVAEALQPWRDADARMMEDRTILRAAAETSFVPNLSSSPADRRAAVRHSCKHESACRSVTAMVDISWPARVIDISRGGVGLQVERRFEPGTLLDIDMQASVPQFHRSLLVRVVNVRSQADGQWIVGCAFANQLSDDELWAFRAERVRPPSADCRAWFRFPPSPDAAHASVPDLQHEAQPAQVLNVSPGGVALLVDCQMEAGTRLRLELQGSAENPPLLKLIYVVHATAQDEGHWLMGCAFAGELTAEELQTLV